MLCFSKGLAKASTRRVLFAAGTVGYSSFCQNVAVALELTQLSIWWSSLFPPGESGARLKLTTHFHLVPRLGVDGAWAVYSFMAWSLVKDNVSLLYHTSHEELEMFYWSCPERFTVTYTLVFLISLRRGEWIVTVFKPKHVSPKVKWGLALSGVLGLNLCRDTDIWRKFSQFPSVHQSKCWSITSSKQRYLVSNVFNSPIILPFESN
jgi:hypothetical protein